MTEHRVISTWTGFCASCPVEQPLLLVSRGPHGFRAWLAGAGPEDRALSYVCAVCGRVEHVPATEADDEAYDATLVRWPDWVADEQPAEAPVAPVAPAALDLADVFGLAAVRMAVAPASPAPAAAAATAPALARPGTVRVVTLPVQRVSATDLVLTRAA